MSGQSYHSAISADALQILLHCEEEEETLAVTEELYGSMGADDGESWAGGYKEWPVLHRCLSDGTFDPAGGAYPLNRCFLGGRLLATEGSIVNLVMPNEVRDLAEALDHLDKGWFQDRFKGLFASEYTSRGDLEGDSERFWQMASELRDFYRRAADTGRAVVFYTDDPLDHFFRGNSS
jgi:hypothetical protein